MSLLRLFYYGKKIWLIYYFNMDDRGVQSNPQLYMYVTLTAIYLLASSSSILILHPKGARIPP